MKIISYFLQFFKLDDISDIQQLREKILQKLLFSASVLGAAAYALAIIPAIERKIFSAVLIYSISYAGFLGITFIPHTPYRFRVYGLLFFLYVLGLHNLSHSGFNVDAGLFFLTHVVIAVLFLDLRKANIALVLCLISIACMGFLTVQNNYALSISLSQRNPFLWMIGGLIFLFAGVITTLSISVLITGLTENLEKTKKISFTLERKNKELFESELHFRSLVETSPNAIIRFDKQGALEAVNLAGEMLLGYQQAEVLGKNVNDFLSSEEQNRVKHTLEQVFVEGIIVRDFNISLQHKSGTPVLVELSAAPILNAREDIVGVICIGKDITDKTRAEEALRAQAEEIKINRQELRTLTHQLISAQEDERRVISRELHDDAGQALVTLKHGISIILEELNDEKGSIILEERLERSLDLIDQAMAYVRSASHRLRPPALEVGGLDVGLQELCRQSSLQTNLQINYEGVTLLEIPDDLAISLYRFVQEALTNTLKHAEASDVDVRLTYRDDKIILSVADNGCGYRKGQVQQRGSGLIGLQERFAFFSGRIDVDLRRTQGYSITVTVPWKKHLRRKADV